MLPIRQLTRTIRELMISYEGYGRKAMYLFSEDHTPLASKRISG